MVAQVFCRRLGEMTHLSNLQPICWYWQLVPVCVPATGDDDDDEYDACEIAPDATLLSLSRAQLIMVLEFACPQRHNMTAARLSVIGDSQLRQLAVLAIGTGRAQQSAGSTGARTIGSFKHMVKAFALEHGWLERWDGNSNSLDAAFVEVGVRAELARPVRTPRQTVRTARRRLRCKTRPDSTSE